MTHPLADVGWAVANHLLRVFTEGVGWEAWEICHCRVCGGENGHLSTCEVEGLLCSLLNFDAVYDSEEWATLDTEACLDRLNRDIDTAILSEWR